MPVLSPGIAEVGLGLFAEGYALRTSHNTVGHGAISAAPVPTVGQPRGVVRTGGATRARHPCYRGEGEELRSELSPLVILFGEETLQFSVLGTKCGNPLQILGCTRLL